MLSSFPGRVQHNGFHKEGRREEEPFCHQRVSDQRMHHQQLQAHPWNGFQEVCPLGPQRDLEICHEGDGSSRLNKAVLAKGIRNVLYYVHVWLSR